jgi:hypothetical protein
MCWSHIARYACGCDGQTLKFEKCDHRREVDRRPLRPLRPGEVDHKIAYYAGLCRGGSEKSFKQRDYKCAICKRNDVLIEMAEREAEEKRKWSRKLMLKRTGKGKDMGMGSIRDEAAEK